MRYVYHTAHAGASRPGSQHTMWYGGMWMPYRILAIGNNKGGVGKTFIAKTIAEYAALVRKERVLLVDLDPQTNLSRRYLDMQVLTETSDYGPPLHPEYDPNDEEDDWDGYSDSADIWLEGSAAPYPTRIPGLEIIPAQAHKLQDIEYVRRRDLYDAVIRHLGAFLQHEDVRSDYDLVILDTRPSKGPLVQAALHAATHLLIPTQLEAPAVEGLQGMLTQRRLVNRDRPAADQLRLVGVLPNLVRHITLHREYRDLLSDPDYLGGTVLPAEISDWAGYRESMMFGAESIFVAKQQGRLREQLSEVCALIFDQMEAA